MEDGIIKNPEEDGISCGRWNTLCGRWKFKYHVEDGNPVKKECQISDKGWNSYPMEDGTITPVEDRRWNSQRLYFGCSYPRGPPFYISSRCWPRITTYLLVRSSFIKIPKEGGILDGRWRMKIKQIKTEDGRWKNQTLTKDGRWN